MNILVTYTDGHTSEFRARDMVNAERMALEYVALDNVAKVEAIHQQQVVGSWS